MTPDEINEIINNIQYLHPESNWAKRISLLEYNECYLYIRWLAGMEENAPDLRHLTTDQLGMVRTSLSRFLLDKTKNVLEV